MKSKLDNIQLLTDAVLKSTCVGDVLKILSMSSATNNYNRFWNRVQQYNIDTAHFVHGGISKRWDKSTLQKYVEESECYRDVLVKMGLGIEGGNNGTLRKYIKQYGLDVSHFDGQHIRKSSRKMIIPAANMFIENSLVSRSTVKKYVIKLNLIKSCCAKCQNVGMWMDETLSLQLEHKNGINNDNRLENLEFLCPNCHSQTLTYAGKNNLRSSPSTPAY